MNPSLVFTFLIIGMLLGISLLCSSGDIVRVNGKKDAIQTVEWNGKNYKLVPLGAGSKENQ